MTDRQPTRPKGAGKQRRCTFRDLRAPGAPGCGLGEGHKGAHHIQTHSMPFPPPTQRPERAAARCAHGCILPGSDEGRHLGRWVIFTACRQHGGSHSITVLNETTAPPPAQPVPSPEPPRSEALTRRMFEHVLDCATGHLVCDDTTSAQMEQIRGWANIILAHDAALRADLLAAREEKALHESSARKNLSALVAAEAALAAKDEALREIAYFDVRPATEKDADDVMRDIAKAALTQVRVGEDRQEAEEFVAWVNARLASQPLDETTLEMLVAVQRERDYWERIDDDDNEHDTRAMWDLAHEMLLKATEAWIAAGRPGLPREKAEK